MILNFDILIAMNNASVKRFQQRLKKKGLLLFDSSLVHGVAFADNIFPVGIPATKIAAAVRDVKAANMVMPGALIEETGILKKSSFDILFSFSGRPFGDKAAGINKNSILEGIKYLENKKSRYF